MPRTRRVVITGLGVVTPLGLDRHALWEAIQAGRCSIGTIRNFDTSNLPVRIASQIEKFDAREFLEKKERKRLNSMVRTMQLALAASAQAANEAQLRQVPPDAARFGTVFGSAVIPAPEDLGPAAWATTGGKPGPVDLIAWGERGIPNVPPMWLLSCIPNVTTGHVSILHGGQGPNNTITLSDAAGLFAIGEGFRVIGRDRADVMMTGAADTEVLPLHFARHCVFAPLSRHNDDPAHACRPFDRRRDGSVAGEGAVALVLEEEQHAHRRGVKPLAEVLGFGASFDRARDGGGLARAIRTALAQAEMQPGDIDHVNAHGLSTQESDRLEARAIREVFGEIRVPVFAAKSYFGNLGAGSSLAELTTSFLAVKHGTLPATLHHEEPDPECPVDVVVQARPVERPVVLKVSFTDLGQCAAAVFRYLDV